MTVATIAVIIIAVKEVSEYAGKNRFDKLPQAAEEALTH